MSKKMCDLSKKKYDKLDLIGVKYYCRMCGRVSDKKKRLCDPKKR